MDYGKSNMSGKLVPENYLKLAQDAQKSRETEKRELLEKVTNKTIIKLNLH